MGGVDQMDFYLAVYRARIRSNKWYWPLFSWVLMVSLIAAWKLWKSHCSAQHIKHRRSGLMHFLRLINKKIRNEFPRQDQNNTETLLLDKEQTTRFDKKDHIIFETHQSRTCKMCQERLSKRSKYECKKCNVGLHPGCFAAFHG